MQNTENQRKTIREKVTEFMDGGSVLLADGFDDAFLGIGMQFHHAVAVYDKEKCIDILVAGGMQYDEAVEFFMYNVQGAYVGNQTPIYLTKL
jgi:hypothetical protein